MMTVTLMNEPFYFFLSSVLIFQDKNKICQCIVFKNVYEPVITNHNYWLQLSLLRTKVSVNCLIKSR